MGSACRREATPGVKERDGVCVGQLVCSHGGQNEVMVVVVGWARTLARVVDAQPN